MQYITSVFSASCQGLCHNTCSTTSEAQNGNNVLVSWISKNQRGAATELLTLSLPLGYWVRHSYSCLFRSYGALEGYWKFAKFISFMKVIILHNSSWNYIQSIRGDETVNVNKPSTVSPQLPARSGQRAQLIQGIRCIWTHVNLHSDFGHPCNGTPITWSRDRCMISF
jgi:hypothetical protein